MIMTEPGLTYDTVLRGLVAGRPVHPEEERSALLSSKKKKKTEKGRGRHTSQRERKRRCRGNPRAEWRR
jgi:hypothetical protein